MSSGAVCSLGFPAESHTRYVSVAPCAASLILDGMLLTLNLGPHEARSLVSGKGFDPDGACVSKYVPELAGLDSRDIHAPYQTPSAHLAAGGVTLAQDYPHPIVVHAEVRAHSLASAEAQVKG